MSKRHKKMHKGYSVIVLLLFLVFGGTTFSDADMDTIKSILSGENGVYIWMEEAETGRNNDDRNRNIPTDEMEVHFIDVGQGDATLILCGGEAMLIDAGEDSKGIVIQNYIRKQGVKELKYLILTHTDSDHIGGADVIVTKFDVDTVFMGDYPKDNRNYRELIEAFDYKNLSWETPNVGNVYELGSAEFTIVAPNREYEDANNVSIGLLLENGNDSFLFTGDAEEEAEFDILANGLDLDCDVFKAGHHGSKTSNSEEFLKATSPEYIVISCEDGNSYGHPHAGPLNRFRSIKAKVFRTDEQGSIIAFSNGDSITWNSAPSESWKVGERKE